MRQDHKSCTCAEKGPKEDKIGAKGRSTTHIRVQRETLLELDRMGKFISANFAKDLNDAGIIELTKMDVLEFAVERAQSWLTFQAESSNPFLIKSKIGRAIMTTIDKATQGGN